MERDSGTEVTLAGEQLLVVSERDVLGIFAAPGGEGRAGAAVVADEVITPVLEPERKLPGAAREESLETDVAPDLLDREAVPGEHLH
jgi:hypothetical protein